MRIGIIGTGRIASRFADTAFAGIESAYVSCVYNPKAASAEKFAIQHRIENYTDSLDELTMLTDAVYIASLHETHYEYAKYMLNNKKHVLCEKPAVLKKAQAEELYSLAKENNVEVLYKETNSSRTLKNLLEDGYNLGIIRYAEHYDKYYKQMLEEKGFNSELVTEFKYVLIVNKDSPLAKKKQLSFKDLDDYIEVAHGDPYVPSLVFSTVRKEEFQDSIKKRIFVFERASQFEILSKNLNAFMFVSPVPKSTLDRYGLVIKECEDNNKVYKDVMIYRKSYRLTKLDLDFISSLCEAKRMYM